MPAVLSPVLGTDQIDVGRGKFNSNNAALNTALAAVESRTTALEARNYPAGTVIGAAALTFTYSPNAGTPVSATPRTPTATFAGLGSDNDGRAATCWLSNTRLGVVSLDSTATSSSNFRATFLDLSGGGGFTNAGSGIFGNAQGTGGTLSQFTVYGAAAVATGSMRSYCFHTSNTNVNFFSQATINIDGSNVVTSSLDSAPNVSAGSSPPAFYTGYTYRKRGYLVGSFGAMFFRPVITYNEAAASLVATPGAHVVERNATAFSSRRSLGSQLTVNAFAADMIATGLALILSDSMATGASAAQAEISLASVGDRAGGESDGLPLGNVLAGNPRLTALSESLFEYGFTVGSQYGSGVGSRVPATNALSTVGAYVTAGALGTVPLEILPLRATRSIHVIKGAGASVSLAIYDINPAAGAGVSPFTLLTTLTFNLGQDLAGATAGDAHTVMDVCQPPNNPDRLVFTFRNTTRSLNGVQAIDLTY